MKLLRRVPEEAMVSAFLKAEFFSARFGDDLRTAMTSFGVADAVVTHPDISNDRENQLRSAVLGAYRGYRQNREMFEGVPENLTWYEAELTRCDIANLRYVDYSYWNELTDQTRLVKDAVANIRQGKIVFDVPNDRFLSMAEDIRRGIHIFEPIILWGQDIGSSLEILEGHLRATAFGLADEKAPTDIRALVGLVHSPASS
jgi:hypothetical protein